MSHTFTSIHCKTVSAVAVAAKQEQNPSPVTGHQTNQSVTPEVFADDETSSSVATRASNVDDR